MLLKDFGSGNKILHPYISENNIITHPRTADGFTSMLIDLDLAIADGERTGSTILAIAQLDSRASQLGIVLPFRVRLQLFNLSGIKHQQLHWTRDAKLIIRVCICLQTVSGFDPPDMWPDIRSQLFLFFWRKQYATILVAGRKRNAQKDWDSTRNLKGSMLRRRSIWQPQRFSQALKHLCSLQNCRG